MDDEMPAAVLFLDVHGSTELTRNLGDVEAGRIMRALLDTLGNLVREHGGWVVKSDGDDLIACFDPAPDATQRAALATISAMVAATESGLGLYAGLGSGPVQKTEVLGRPDIAGRTVITAARLHKLFEGLAGNVFLDAASAERLSPDLRARCSEFGVRKLKGLGDLEVFALGWRDGAGKSTTFAGTAPDFARSEAKASRLVLRFAGKTHAFDSTQGTVFVGRDPPQPRVVVPGNGVSGRHLDLVWDGEAWQVRDRSRCGTWLSLPGSAAGLALAGKSQFLLGNGTLCLGRPFAEDPAGEVTVEFSIESPP